MTRKKNADNNLVKNPDIEKWREEKRRERRRLRARELYRQKLSKTGRTNKPRRTFANEEERAAAKKEYERAYRQANREKYRAYWKAYKQKNAAKREENYYAKHKEELRSYWREYRLKNTAKVRERNRLGARKKRVTQLAINAANIRSHENLAPVYTSNQLQNMSPEKLARLIDSKHFQMAAVR